MCNIVEFCDIYKYSDIVVYYHVGVRITNIGTRFKEKIWEIKRNFSPTRPLGQVGYKFAMSLCLSVCAIAKTH